MLTPLLLAHAFAYCSGNPIYDAPGGRVVEFQQPVEMVHIDHSWDDGWVEVFPTDGQGNSIGDGEQSYWMRMDGCWGSQVGV